MVSVFLSKVNSVKIDQGLAGELALSISKLIDQIEPAYIRSLDQWVIEHLTQEEIEMRDIHYFVSELVRGTMKISYDKRGKTISQYLDVICSGQLLKDLRSINLDVVDGSIIKFIRSLNIGVQSL